MREDRLGRLTPSMFRKKVESHRDSYRKDMSPLTQGLNYRSACDIKNVSGDTRRYNIERCAVRTIGLQSVISKSQCNTRADVSLLVGELFLEPDVLNLHCI